MELRSDGPSHIGLVVPVKPLAIAKSRLRVPATVSAAGSTILHEVLVLAMVLDTVAAACESTAVSKILVVTSDEIVVHSVSRLGVEAMIEPGAIGLNAALSMGARELQRRSKTMRVGALTADLPALSSIELTAALCASNGQRAYCRDRQGTGTTLLIADPGQDLDPRFGSMSALAHEESAALELRGPWPSLSCDVDTGADLVVADALGLGIYVGSLRYASV